MDGITFLKQLKILGDTPRLSSLLVKDAKKWLSRRLTKVLIFIYRKEASEEKYRIMADFTYDWEFWIISEESPAAIIIRLYVKMMARVYRPKGRKNFLNVDLGRSLGWGTV